MGNIHVTVSEAIIDGDVYERQLVGDNDQIGAVVRFTGKVRRFAGHNEPLILEYYPGMTEDKLESIGRVAMDRFDLDGVSVVHRVGAMLPQDDIVLVLAASRHRQAAFDGAAYIMDYLKTDAPFWKKEGENWVDARESDTRAHERWGL